MSPCSCTDRFSRRRHGPEPSHRAHLPAAPTAGQLLFAPTFPTKTQLVTNDFAYWNLDQKNAVRSDVWRVTSGSLFSRAGTGWTGRPDAVHPNANSTNGTGSAIFRLVTARRDFGNVRVSFDLLNEGFGSTAKTPPQAWDGIHLFLRYHSQHSLYYVSINRRDQTVTIKKKHPGGTTNGGTYYSLSGPVQYRFQPGRWQHVTAWISNGNADTTIGLAVDGQTLLTVTDHGTGSPPILTPGAVGLRGDNTEFQFTHFQVTALANR